MPKTISSPAKLQVIDFIKTAKDGEEYSFILAGNHRFAEKFVHRMRVELSRLREKVKERNRVVRPFKVLLKSIIYCQQTNKCTIVLLKSVGDNDVSGEVDDIFDKLAGGNRIEQ